MTALDRYVRLESEALWRAEPDGQRRDVTISFGDATLVIADATGRPLAHWSLPALMRQNPEETPALYAPDEDASEILEIADTTMIDAIEEVRAALAKSRPHPGKLRYWLTGGLIVATLALAIFWLPGALTRQTLAVVPPQKRVEIGAEMLGYVQVETGSACQAPRTDVAARRLAQRVFGAGTSAQIIVVPRLRQGAVALPGMLFVLDYDMVRAADDPAVAAGYLLAAQTAALDIDPLEAILKDAGLATTFRLLTTGNVPSTILRESANTLVQKAPSTTNAGALNAAFVNAAVPKTPYLKAVDARTGSMPNLGPDPLENQDIPLILDDSDWVSLQNVCNL